MQSGNSTNKFGGKTKFIGFLVNNFTESWRAFAYCCRYAIHKHIIAQHKLVKSKHGQKDDHALSKSFLQDVELWKHWFTIRGQAYSLQPAP